MRSLPDGQAGGAGPGRRDGMCQVRRRNAWGHYIQSSIVATEQERQWRGRWRGNGRGWREGQQSAQEGPFLLCNGLVFIMLALRIFGEF